jgi:hypothetical protein
MTHLKRIGRPVVPLLMLALLALGACSSDRPCTNQDLVVAAPVYSHALYPKCQGRSVRVIAHMQPHGSRVEALRVLVTNDDGAVDAHPPSVRMVGGAKVQAITTDGAATVLWFACPGPCDGTCVTMQVTVPNAGPCPYRIRLVPVFRGA